jgi:hypothetical protein
MPKPVLRTVPRNFPAPGKEKRFAFGTVGDLRALVKMLDAAGVADENLIYTGEDDKVDVTNFGTHTAVRVVKADWERPAHGW